jgi:hypothetical protein
VLIFSWDAVRLHFTFTELPSKLLTSTGFSQKIFFFSIFFIGGTLLKNFDQMYKIRDFVMSKSKFWLVDYTVPPKNFSQGVEVTSWAANFDRYIHFLKIMAAREKCMTLGTCTSLKTVWGGRARSITRGSGRGGPWKSRFFWALKWLRAKRVPFGPKKVEISRGHPFQVQMPQIIDLPLCR